jgi:2-oxoglutarate/2-oxoacid ferredoxin oxidoreductase subunit alpha
MPNPSKINNSLNWLIGGAQGSGVDSAANIFSRACAQGGLHVFGKREYYSNIKGEHSYFTVRVSEREVRSHVDEISMLVSFDAETLLRHAGVVTKAEELYTIQNLLIPRSRRYQHWMILLKID